MSAKNAQLMAVLSRARLARARAADAADWSDGLERGSIGWARGGRPEGAREGEAQPLCHHCSGPLPRGSPSLRREENGAGEEEGKGADRPGESKGRDQEEGAASSAEGSPREEKGSRAERKSGGSQKIW
eukprot:scaffold209822_cov26-Tisochrysis_lutea.AAC.2